MAIGSNHAHEHEVSTDGPLKSSLITQFSEAHFAGWLLREYLLQVARLSL